MDDDPCWTLLEVADALGLDHADAALAMARAAGVLAAQADIPAPFFAMAQAHAAHQLGPHEEHN